MNKNETTIMGCLGWIAFAAIGIILGAIVGGWALSILWGWFIVPVFGLPTLTIGQAVGVSIVIGYLMPKTEPNDKKSHLERLAFAFSVSLIGPLFSVGIGWIVLQFIQ